MQHVDSQAGKLVAFKQQLRRCAARLGQVLNLPGAMVSGRLAELEADHVWREVHVPGWGDVDSVLADMRVDSGLRKFEHVLNTCEGTGGGGEGITGGSEQPTAATQPCPTGQ